MTTKSNAGINIIGNRYGKLVVISCVIPSEGKYNGCGRWLCRCDCGKEKEINGRALIHTTSSSKSCGCLQKEAQRKMALAQRAPDRVTYTTKYLSHKSSSKVRGYIPLLKDIWMSIVTKSCHYCGEIDMRNEFLGSNLSYRKKRNVQYTQEEISVYTVPCNGIDRVDSDKGYEIENCVPCCSQCNYMKLEYPKEQFLKKVDLIHLKQSYGEVSIESFLCN